MTSWSRAGRRGHGQAAGVRAIPAAVLVVVLLATGCGSAERATRAAADCAALARDAAATRVDAPSAQQLDQQVRRLDDRIRSIRDADVRAAAERVRDSLRRLADAVRTGDRRDINRATADPRRCPRRRAGVQDPGGPVPRLRAYRPVCTRTSARIRCASARIARSDASTPRS